MLADWLRQKLITEPQQKQYRQGYADGLKAATERQNTESETPAETPRQSEQSN